MSLCSNEQLISNGRGQAFGTDDEFVTLIVPEYNSCDSAVVPKFTPCYLGKLYFTGKDPSGKLKQSVYRELFIAPSTRKFDIGPTDSLTDFHTPNVGSHCCDLLWKTILKVFKNYYVCLNDIEKVGFSLGEWIYYSFNCYLKWMGGNTHLKNLPSAEARVPIEYASWFRSGLAPVLGTSLSECCFLRLPLLIPPITVPHFKNPKAVIGYSDVIMSKVAAIFDHLPHVVRLCDIGSTTLMFPSCVFEDPHPLVRSCSCSDHISYSGIPSDSMYSKRLVGMCPILKYFDY